MKKRFFLMFLLVLVVVFAVGCSANDMSEPNEGDVSETVEEVEDVAEEVQGFTSYEEILQIADTNRSPYVAGNAQETLNIDQYAISDKALLTQEEMDALREVNGSGGNISITEAKEDIDLFFRTWKYVYPSYYFMGEEIFLNAKQQAIDAVSAYSNELSKADFREILYESMSFLQDDHSSINEKSPTRYEDDLHYLSYCDTAQPFDKDENGFYQTYEGVKWYYSTSSNSSMRIEPTLLPTGKVAYCPLLLIPKADAVETDTITLKNGEEEKQITVQWVVGEDVSYFKDQQCEVTTSQAIYYIDYFTMRTDVGDLNDFIQTGNEAKQYKAVIFDLRHTIGYTHYQILDWVKLFAGEKPAVNRAFLTRNNALRTLQNYEGFKAVSMGNEDCNTWYVDGRETSNQIPLIILIDKSCASSVEEACNYLRSLENSIVIGSNTAGCSQGGSVQTYYLPHSGARFAIGGFMEFTGEVENIDGIGYEPDIWCNPADALTSALLFLQNYDLADEESVQLLYNELQPPPDLHLQWYEHKIPVGGVFGNIVGKDNFVTVVVDGKAVTDFSVTSEVPTKLVAEKETSGKVQLIQMESFEGEYFPFTITYQGHDFTFNCNDDTWVVN